MMIDSRGRIIERDEDDDDQPECSCGELLPWEPQVQRRIVGYPGQEFTQVVQYRICPSCGARQNDGGWYE